MTGTSYTDASGLDSSTTSTAADQVRLGMAAMQVPALAAIVDMPTAVVPVAGTIRKTNTLLGQDGIAGLKTGSTQAAGGCILIAAWQEVSGRNTPDRGRHLRPARHGRDHPAERIASRPQPRACPGPRPRPWQAARFAS